MEEKVFVGFGYGKFEADDGRMLPYCNVFVLEPFVGEQNEDYRYGGQKAVKYGCVSKDVFKDIPVGSKVRCFFDGRRKVSFMVPSDQAADFLESMSLSV